MLHSKFVDVIFLSMLYIVKMSMLDCVDVTTWVIVDVASRNVDVVFLTVLYRKNMSVL